MYFTRIVRKFWLPIIGALLISGCARSPQETGARYLNKGKGELGQKNYVVAILHFKNAVKSLPNDPEPYYQLGLAYLGTNDLRMAVACFRKATELNPKHTGAQLKLAELMSQTNDKTVLEEAAKRANEVLSQQPGDVAALNTLAVAELRLGKPDSAEGHLDQALKKSPGYLRSSVILATSRLARKDVKGAEEALQQAISQAPKSPDPVVSLGEFYLAIGKPDEAEKSFRHALEISANHGPALLNLAALQARAGKTEEADKIYQQLATLPEKRYKTIHALFLFQSGKHDAAIAEFERLAKAEPADRELRTLLVRAYLALNRVTQAEQVLTAALQKNPKETEALVARGQIFLSSRKYSEAEKDLNQVLQFRKDSAEAHYFKAKVHQARGENGNYQQELGEALRLEPAFLTARIERAQALTLNRGAQQALELLDQAPGQQKASGAVVLQRNVALIALGRWQEARKGIDQVLAAGKIPEAMLQNAAVKLEEKNYPGARSAAEAVLQEKPDEVRALTALLKSYEGENQKAVGLQKVREYAARQPKSDAVQQFLGRVLAANGDKAGARVAFEAAKAANPSLVTAELALAEMDVREGKRDEARKRLSAVISANSTNVPARYLSAQVEYLDGKTEAAIAQYRKLLTLDDKNVMALNDLGYLLAENKQPDEALKYAQQAKELAPENSAVDDTIGWAYYQKGMYSMAVTHLQSAVAKNATARRRYHLAMAYAKAGEGQKGQQTFEAAWKMDPQLPEAQAARQLLDSKTR